MHRPMQFLTTVNVGSGRVSHAWKHGVADVISILSESDLRGDGFCPRVAVVDGGNLIFGCQCYQLNARRHIVAAASIGVCIHATLVSCKCTKKHQRSCCVNWCDEAVDAVRYSVTKSIQHCSINLAIHCLLPGCLLEEGNACPVGVAL